MNRDIIFCECDIDLKCMSIDKDEIEEGTIESTKAAKEFQSLNLFDPDKKVEVKIESIYSGDSLRPVFLKLKIQMKSRFSYAYKPFHCLVELESNLSKIIL